MQRQELIPDNQSLEIYKYTRRKTLRIALFVGKFFLLLLQDKLIDNGQQTTDNGSPKLKTQS